MAIQKFYVLASAVRVALFAAATTLPMTAAFSQPSAPMQMPAEVVKPMPSASNASKPGADMKPGMGMGAGTGIGMGMGMGMNKSMGAGMDMKPMMTDMNDKMMGMKSSGNADVDFAVMMKIHHQGAVTMAEAQLQNGKDGQMRAMAKDIIRAQKKEIAVFDKFLAKRREPDTKMGNPDPQTNK